LVNADAQIENLKEQLDATLGAEDMLEIRNGPLLGILR